MILTSMSGYGKDAARRLLHKRRDFIYQRASNERARKTYCAIIAQYPDRRVTDRVRRDIRDYAHVALGSAVYAPWLETYTAFRGAIVEGWLPLNYIQQYVTSAGFDQYQAIEAKTLSAAVLQTNLLPDLGYRINGRYYDRSMTPLSREHFVDRIFRDEESAFLKLERSKQGLGVFRVTRADFSLVAEDRGNFCIQRPIVHHPFFDALSFRAVATLRMTTVTAADGAIELRAAYLRLGRSNDDIVKSKSAIRVPLDIRTGRLFAEATLPDWTRTDHHPDSGATFAEETVPAFGKAIEACLALHKKIPHVRVAGWDICVTPEEEPALFEVNVSNPSTAFSEAATGPIFQGLGWESLHKKEKPARR